MPTITNKPPERATVPAGSAIECDSGQWSGPGGALRYSDSLHFLKRAIKGAHPPTLRGRGIRYGAIRTSRAAGAVVLAPVSS